MKSQRFSHIKVACKGIGLVAAFSVLMGAAGVASASDEDRIKVGKAKYDKLCALCHEADVGPELKGRQLPPSYISAIVRNGFLAMPAFPHTHLSDEELLAVGEYIQQTPAPEASEAK